MAAEGASDPFASEGSAPAFSEAPAFTEAPPQQAAQDTFAYEPSVVAEPPPPPVPTGPSPYQCVVGTHLRHIVHVPNARSRHTVSHWLRF